MRTTVVNAGPNGLSWAKSPLKLIVSQFGIPNKHVLLRAIKDTEENRLVCFSEILPHARRYHADQGRTLSESFEFPNSFSLMGVMG
jgi:hypothetical protein